MQQCKDELDWIKDANFVSAEEAATLLRMTIQAVYRWLRESKIDGTKIGKCWWIPSSEINRIWREGRNCSSEAASPKAAPVAATRLSAQDEMEQIVTGGRS